MNIIIQLLILCILFFICLRYDLGLSYSKCISRSVLFTLLISVVFISTHSNKEGLTYNSNTEPDPSSESDTCSDTSSESGSESGSQTVKEKKKVKKK